MTNCAVPPETAFNDSGEPAPFWPALCMKQSIQRTSHGGVNGNRAIDSTDLVLLLSAWGPCAG